MVVSHSGVLGARALRRRRLVPHALVAVGGLRHLPARGQLSPRQLATARAQAAALEPAAGAAQIPVLHARYQPLPHQPEHLMYGIQNKASGRSPRRAGRVPLVSKGATEGSQPLNWMSREYIELCRLQTVSDPVIVFAGVEDRALAPLEIE